MLNAIEFFVEEFKFYKNMKLNKHLESGYKSFCNDKSIFTWKTEKYFDSWSKKIS